MSWLPDWLTGYDAQNAAAADAADRRRAELDAQRYESGWISLEEYQRRGQGGYGVSIADQRGDIQDTFNTAVAENAAALPGKISGSLSGLTWGILGSIPPVLWIAGAVALFFWMGGATLLKGRLK